MKFFSLSSVTKIPRSLLGRFKRASRKRKIVIVICLIVLFMIVSSIIQNASKKPSYTLVKVTKSDVSEVVSETGSITTGSNTAVYSPATGVVQKVLVQNGDSVSKGDVLFSIVSTASEQEQSAANASYLTALATLNAANSNADLYRADMYAKWKTYLDMSTNSTYETNNGNAKESERLAAEFQITQDNWKAAEAKYKDQQTAIAQAKSQVNSSLLMYQATQNATVKSPADGTIANLSSLPGNSVKAFSATGTTTPVLSVANFSTTEAVIALSELDATKVIPGQQVALDVSAINEKKYRGTVSRVDDIGTNNQGVITYNVYIRVPDSDRRLKSGMTVDVDITTTKRTNVLTVPNAAVKPYQGGRAVRVLNPTTKEVVYKPVKIGIKGNDKTEIVEGLSLGQEVITTLANDQIKRPGLF